MNGNNGKSKKLVRTRVEAPSKNLQGRQEGMEPKKGVAGGERDEKEQLRTILGFVATEETKNNDYREEKNVERKDRHGGLTSRQNDG